MNDRHYNFNIKQYQIYNINVPKNILKIITIKGYEQTCIINEVQYKHCQSSISKDLSSIYWVAFDKTNNQPIDVQNCIQQCSPIKFDVLGLFDHNTSLKRVISTPEPHYNVQLEITLGNCQGWQVNNQFQIYVDEQKVLEYKNDIHLQSFILDFPHSSKGFDLKIDHNFSNGVIWGVKSFLANIQQCYYELTSKNCLCPNNYIPRQQECIVCSNISGITIDPKTNECKEICGDGKRITNQFGCDDGNNINGDGCNSTCDVEQGWRCSGGSSTTPAYLRANNNDNGPIVTIKFNKQIRIVGQWEGKYMQIEIANLHIYLLKIKKRVGDADYKISYPLDSNKGSEFNITITSDKSIRNSMFVLDILKTQSIVDDIANTKIYQKQFTLKLADFTYIPFEQRQITQSISDAANGISIGMILSFLPLLLSGNFFLLANTIEITEMIYHYQFVDVRYPFNVNQFFLVFNNFELPMVPNIFEFFYDSDIKLYSPSRLQEIKIDSFFMRNAGQSFTIIFVLIFLNIMTKILSLNWNKWKRFRSFCQNLLDNQFKYSWYFDVVTTTYLNLAVSSFMQFYDNSSEDITLIANLFFSYVTFVLVILWPFFMTYYIYVRRNIIHLEEVQEKMSSLMEGLKTDTLFQAMFQTVVFVRKLYLAFVINFMINATHMQLNFLGIFNIFFILLRITYQPQMIPFQEFVNIMTEILLFATQISIQQLKDDVNQTEEERIQSGWSIIGCSSAIIVFHAMFLVYETLKIAYKYIQKKREEKRMKKQVQPSKDIFSINSNIKLNPNNILSIENVNEEHKPTIETKENIDINSNNNINNRVKNINLAIVDQSEQMQDLNLLNPTNRNLQEDISGTSRNLIIKSLMGLDQNEGQNQNNSQINLPLSASRNSLKFGSQINFLSKPTSQNIQ